MNSFEEESGISGAETVRLSAAGGEQSTPPRQSSDMPQSTHLSMPGMVGISPMWGYGPFQMGQFQPVGPTSWSPPPGVFGADGAPRPDPNTEGANRPPFDQAAYALYMVQSLQQTLVQQGAIMQQMQAQLLQQQVASAQAQATAATAASLASSQANPPSPSRLGASTSLDSVSRTQLVTSKAKPDISPGLVRMGASSKHVDPLSISQVHTNLEESRTTDVNNGHDPKYRVSDFMHSPVLAALCANERCMAALGERIVIGDITDNVALVTRLAFLEDKDFIPILSILCIRSKEDTEMLIRGYFRSGSLPLEPWPTGDFSQQALTQFRAGLYKTLNLLKKACSYCRDGASDDERFLLWDKERTGPHHLLRHFLDFIFGGLRSSQPAESLHNILEALIRKLYRGKCAASDNAKRDDPAHLINLQWESIREAFKDFTDKALKVMQEHEDWWHKYKLPDKPKSSPRAALGDLLEEHLPEDMAEDEALRALDSCGPQDRVRSQFPSARVPFQGSSKNDPKAALQLCFNDFRAGTDACRKGKSCSYAHRRDFATDHQYDLALLSMLNAQFEALLKTPIAQKLRLPDSTMLHAELKQYPLLLSAMRKPLSAPAQGNGPRDVTRHPRVAFGKLSSPMDDDTFVVLQKKGPTTHDHPEYDTKQYLEQLDARLLDNEATTAARAAGASESPSA